MVNTIKTFPCTNVYNLAEFNMIAGSYKELYFYLYTSGSVPIDVRGVQASWTLTPFDTPDHVVLSKDGECYNGYFIIKLLSTDTIGLAGKYIQKPLIISELGYDYRLEQGLINITPANGGA